MRFWINIGPWISEFDLKIIFEIEKEKLELKLKFNLVMNELNILFEHVMFKQRSEIGKIDN